MEFRLKIAGVQPIHKSLIPVELQNYLLPSGRGNLLQDGGRQKLLQEQLSGTGDAYTVYLLHYWLSGTSRIELKIDKSFYGYLFMIEGTARLHLDETIFSPLEESVLLPCYLTKGIYEIAACQAKDEYQLLVLVAFHSPHSIAVTGTQPKFLQSYNKSLLRARDTALLFEAAYIDQDSWRRVLDNRRVWRKQRREQSVLDTDIIEITQFIQSVKSWGIEEGLSLSQHEGKLYWEVYRFYYGVAVMHAHIRRRYSNGRLSDVTALSLDKLQSYAKQYLQTTLHKYQMRISMEHARHLIATTNKTIREVALECDLKPRYFSPAFKEYWQETPTDVRDGKVNE